MEIRFLGKHYIADFYECENREPLINVNVCEDMLLKSALEANATVISKHFKTFEPYGISGVIVIGESHITIHTYPEYNYAAVDVFTCSEKMEPLLAVDYIDNVLKSKRKVIEKFNRGDEINV